MATVTLGNIKLNWKGAYNAGTAYAIDDVVSYNGSSYVAKTATTGNLPTVTANWDIMSQAGTNGTNGTDLTSTLTTQGDILIRNGSGLARLGYGTSGQFLKTQGSGANPVWADSGGGVKQLKQTLKTSSFTSSSGSYVDVTGLSVTITPSSASNRILVMCNASLTAENQSGGLGYLKMIRNVGGGGFSELAESTDSGSYTHGHAEIEFNTAYGHVGSVPLNFLYFDNPNTTSAVIYKMSAKTNGSGTMVLGRSGRADTSSQDIKHATQLIAMEIDGGIL